MDLNLEKLRMGLSTTLSNDKLPILLCIPGNKEAPETVANKISKKQVIRKYSSNPLSYNIPVFWSRYRFVMSVQRLVVLESRNLGIGAVLHIRICKDYVGG